MDLDLTSLGKSAAYRSKFTDDDIKYQLTNSDLDNFVKINDVPMGLPKGRIIDISGLPDSGKSTFALYLISLFQALDLTCTYIDANYSLNPNYAVRLGVDPDILSVYNPDYGEQAFEVIEMLASSYCSDLIVIDSIAGLVPSWEIVGDMANPNYAGQFNMIARSIPKILLAARKSGCIILFVNHISRKMKTREITTIGNRIMDAYSSIRFSVIKDSNIYRGADTTGMKLQINVTKSSKIVIDTNELILPIKFTR